MSFPREPLEHIRRATKFDRYCRIVVQCSLDDSKGGDIGAGLIAAGMAYGLYLDETLPWEPRASQRYATVEAEARKRDKAFGKRGLGESRPQPGRTLSALKCNAGRGPAVPAGRNTLASAYRQFDLDGR
jgi:hypothetical protein